MPFLRRLHQSSLRGLPGGLVSLADWERLGGGFQWRGVGDKVGARRRWKRPFEFPILRNPRSLKEVPRPPRSLAVSVLVHRDMEPSRTSCPHRVEDPRTPTVSLLRIQGIASSSLPF